MIYEKVNIYKDKMIVFMVVMRKVKKVKDKILFECGILWNYCVVKIELRNLKY